MSTQTVSFYNRFSFFYPLVDVFLKRQKRVLFDELNSLPAGKVLEVGVGNGAHLPLYKKHEITGIDTSVAMLDTARKNALANTRLIEMNGEALLFNDNAFDYVVLCHVIAVVGNAEQLLQEVHRVLKPGGQIFILNHFTPNNWLRYIDGGFEVIAKQLQFKSVFHIQDLNMIQKFTLKNDVRVDKLSYFKLLIYQK